METLWILRPGYLGYPGLINPWEFLCLDLTSVCAYVVSVYTFSGPADYIGGTFTAQFGTEADARFCQNIQTVAVNGTNVETDSTFLVNIAIIPGSPLRPGTPDTTTVFITGIIQTGVFSDHHGLPVTKTFMS